MSHDEGHDDQGRNHHEGDDHSTKLAEPTVEPKTTTETSKPPSQISEPNQPKEQSVPMQMQLNPTIEPTPLNPETSEANHETPRESEHSETQPSSPPLYFSQIPVIERHQALQNPVPDNVEMLRITLEGLAILLKPC